MRAERLTDRIGYHLEGPVWWPRADEYRVVDMLAGDVLRIGAGPGGAPLRIPIGSAIAACLRPRRGGGAIIGRERDIALAENDDLVDPRPLAALPAGPGVRGNEGGCDPLGRFLLGTMARDQRAGGGALHRVDPARPGAVETVLAAVTVSNGLAWAAEGDRAYYCDSGTGVVSAIEGDDFAGRRDFVRFDDDEGVPDGCCVDAEGGVWVAANGAGEVRRWSPEGALTAVVEVDARQVTACAFGGPGLRELLITTSREDLDDGDDPAAGSLFAVEPGVAGLPPLEYAG